MEIFETILVEDKKAYLNRWYLSSRVVDEWSKLKELRLKKNVQ